MQGRWIVGLVLPLLMANVNAQDDAPATLTLNKVHPLVAQRFEEGAGQVMVWVFLKDKGPINVSSEVGTMQRKGHPRTVQRRRQRRTAPGLFDKRDLPVWVGYENQLEEMGLRSRVKSRWLNAISVSATLEQVERLGELPFVEKVQIVHALRTITPVRRVSMERTAASQGAFYGSSESQLALINLIALHNEGFTGQGIVIGVLDTGFARTHDAFTNPADPIDVIAEYDFVNNDGNTAPEAGDLSYQHDHGTNVLGVMGANLPGTLVGGAYDASYILVKPENLAFENTSEEDLFIAGLEFIEANGGDLATSSLVIYNTYTQQQLDGMTSVMSLGLKIATENGLHCFQGAGNSGHDSNPATSSLVAPADAFGAITVGAVNIVGSIANFSSDGPTADGRLKPEIVSMGVNTMTTSSSNDQFIVGVNGTSFSTPLTAAAAACIVQKHPDWTVSQLRAALFQTSSQYVANQQSDPAFVWGYGLIDAHAASNADPKRSDTNEDFKVDVVDLLSLLASWGACLPGQHCPTDFNIDGQVDVFDLLQLLAEWS
ncbi:MAG: S8 family serine peptidase [Planctomycetota bacterium]|nr:S8 family serine peptidase [Planctomycetota bacterium]